MSNPHSIYNYCNLQNDAARYAGTHDPLYRSESTLQLFILIYCPILLFEVLEGFFTGRLVHILCDSKYVMDALRI